MCPGFESLIRHQFYGGIAQLVERLHGMQEVSGSIPLTSTSFQRFGFFAKPFLLCTALYIQHFTHYMQQSKASNPLCKTQPYLELHLYTLTYFLEF